MQNEQTEEQRERDRVLGAKVRAALGHLDPQLIYNKDIRECSDEIAKAFQDEVEDDPES